jgi:hypothetical protein
MDTRVTCPHCEKEIQGDELGKNSDCWYYKNNLYSEDRHDVKCPHSSCGEMFTVEVNLCPTYESYKLEEDDV